MDNKKCKKCGQVKNIVSFTREKRNTDGFRGSCNQCIYNQQKSYIKKYTSTEKGKKKYRRMRLEISKRWREKNRWKWLDIKRKWGHKRRFDVLCYYGGIPPKCKECSESRVECLVIDHINNDGYKHRKEMGFTGGHDTYNWIVKNGYPKGFQILCHNCNWVKRARHYESKRKWHLKDRKEYFKKYNSQPTVKERSKLRMRVYRQRLKVEQKQS